MHACPHFNGRILETWRVVGFVHSKGSTKDFFSK